MMIAAYVRVSTEAQAEKDSPALQRGAIEGWLAQRPGAEVRWYEDPGVSGAVLLADRPAGARLLADAADGAVDEVICYAYDRMHRDLADAIRVKTLLDDLEIPLHTVKEGSLEDPFISNIRAVVAAEERRRIGQRSRDGSRTLAKEGRWLGGITPFGYRVRASGETRASGWLEEDPASAPVVREIFRLSAEEGESCVRIAARLNAEGVPTRYAQLDRRYKRGQREHRVAGAWGPGAVRRIITNEVYKGVHRYGRRNTKKPRGKRRPVLVDRAVTAIVDAATWSRAQGTLRRNLIMAGRNAKNDYLLRGLLRCRQCGRTYVGTTTVEAKGGRRYVCGGKYRHLALTDTVCPAPAVDWDIEAQVWRDVVSILERGDLLADAYEAAAARAAGAGDRERDRAATLRRRLAGLDDEEQRLLTRFRKGGIAEASLDRQLAALGSERGEAAAALAEAERVAAGMAAAVDGAGRLRAFLREARTRTSDPDLDFATKRRMIEAVVAGGTVGTIPGPVRVRKRSRWRERAELAVIALEYRLGTGDRPVARTYADQAARVYREAPANLEEAWTRDGTLDHGTRLADLDLEPHLTVLRDLLGATAVRMDKGSSRQRG